LERHFVASYKIKHILPNDPVILLLSIYPRETRAHAHKSVYMNVYESPIHTRSELEITQMSLTGKRINESVIHSYNGLLFGNKLLAHSKYK
jgi:hypothetical protein